MIEINFDCGIFAKLRANAGKLWEGYIHHSFVKQLANASLPERCFKKFLIQDYLFLIHFSRAYALLAAKSWQIADIKNALDGLKAIMEEMPLHVAYAAKWGISEQDMSGEQEALETIAYTRFVLDTGFSGDRLDLMAALIPCVAGYAEIGLGLARSQDTVFKGNPYADWIKNYESDDYVKGVKAFLDMFNTLAQKYNSDEDIQRLSKIFNTATRLETEFWQMGLKG
ncbi:thiaminase II [uncultured Bartonella sp.]|uniref:thiaminase II n=1 Tax=uncultured Bartonella sp. TaxID=104108 RepID=UPI0026327A5D|nr:thiaminase II [uncultured Bartonella sp.]